MYTHTHIAGARKQGHNKQQKNSISLCNIEKKNLKCKSCLSKQNDCPAREDNNWKEKKM